MRFVTQFSRDDGRGSSCNFCITDSSHGAFVSAQEAIFVCSSVNQNPVEIVHAIEFIKRQMMDVRQDAQMEPNCVDKHGHLFTDSVALINMSCKNSSRGS